LDKSLPNTFSEETAIVVGDLYRYGEHWKINAVEAGFFGGLAALCGSFCVDVEEEQPVPTQAVQPFINKPTVQTPTPPSAILEWETNKEISDLYCF
jgi:tellurite resistance protein TerA